MLKLILLLCLKQHSGDKIRLCLSPSQVSCVRCYMSSVTFNLIFYFFYFLQSGGAIWWRVCYQRGLPRLVLLKIDLKHLNVYNLVHMFEPFQDQTPLIFNKIRLSWLIMISFQQPIGSLVFPRVVFWPTVSQAKAMVKMTCDIWPKTHEPWQMTHDRWRELKILSKFQFLSSYRLGVKVFSRYFHKGWMTQSINDKGVCRTAQLHWVW